MYKVIGTTHSMQTWNPISGREITKTTEGTIGEHIVAHSTYIQVWHGR